MHLRAWFAIPCFAALVGSPLARAEPFYTISFLPDWLDASAINDAAQMTGVMRVPGGAHAFLYTDGEVRDLGTLGDPGSFGGTRSFGYAISDKGMVTGDARTASGASHAFIYADGAMRDLGTLPGGRSSIGLGINDAGQVTGSASTGNDETHAMLADSSGMRDLGTLGGNYSYGSGINNAGHVVGASSLGSDASQVHAFLYRDGVMTDLGDLGGVRSFAQGINDRGQIIGAIVDASELARPFVYTDGVVNMLGDFGGWYTGVWDINEFGQVVGYSTFNNDIASRHGFLYTDGKMLDINSLIDPALGWTVVTALGINDAQQILGYACRTDTLCRTVRLDPISAPPIPEPGSAAMWLAGLAAGGLWRGLRHSRHTRGLRPSA